MKKIRFTRNAELERFGRNHPDNPRFEKESVHTLRNDQANRWLERGAAELIEDFGTEDEIDVNDEEARTAAAMRDARAKLEEALRGLEI